MVIIIIIIITSTSTTIILEILVVSVILCCSPHLWIRLIIAPPAATKAVYLFSKLVGSLAD